MYGYLVLGITLPPGLLADDPDACAGTRSSLGRLLGYDEFKARHFSETAFEGLASLYQVEHGRIKHGLTGQHGVIRGRVEEGRLGKVEEHRVAVDSLHLLRGLRVAPLDLVQRRVGLSSHLAHSVNGTRKAMAGAGGINNRDEVEDR